MNKLIFCLALAMLITGTAFIHLTSISISGKVTDEAGVPLNGATVAVKGTKIRTATDAKGEFTLQVPDLKSVLVINYVGYHLQEVTVVNNKKLSITLHTTNLLLDEVIITANGIASRKIKSSSVTRGYNNIYAAPMYQKAEEKKMYNYGWQNGNKADSAVFNREGYDRIVENRFLSTQQNPLSTFSIDVDAASYSNIRRMINGKMLPPAGAVRIEEMINYFTYQYAQPTGTDPFSITTEIAECPWNTAHRLVSIGLQGRQIPVGNLPPGNLTFLIDVSGSMESEDKLPLVKASLKLLLNQLRDEDKVAIVVYAGSAGLVLPPTPGSDKTKIRSAIENLQAGGSTAGGEGIELAYKTAQQNFVKQGNNRVILCTDGDFNVGMSSDDELERLIEDKRKTGIFLTVLGYGTGNYQDAKMQKLADKGNGNHAYIDNQNEAKKVLVNEFGGTLFTIAKDVKLQVEFNPAKVQGYRLIGYENRMLAKEDFNNDKKDAGELGSGHTVTALYEVIPVGVKSDELENVDALKYQQPLQKIATGNFTNELMNIKLRYKQPGGEKSKLVQQPVMDKNASINQASENMRFAAAVAQFGMLLRNSAYKGSSNYKLVTTMAGNALGLDSQGYRKEFLALVKKAGMINKKDVAKIEDDY